jgi:hypothetical protein
MYHSRCILILTIHQARASASKFEAGKLRALQPQIPDVDDAVIDMFSRGHGGREDGSLTLAVTSSTVISLKQLQEVIHIRTSLNAVEWATK